MNRWVNRVAVITGASSGIGAASVKDLVAKGMIVVALARRENRLQELKAQLPEDQAKRFYYRVCDIAVEQQVIETFAWIDQELGGADVLVNNAGIVRNNVFLVDADNGKALREILDTNVLGVSWCTREAFQSMQRRKVDDGHIVIVNSIAGHHVPIVPHVSMNMYPSSKYAITAMTEVLRQEFLAKGSKTKITSISPGAVDTEIIDRDRLTGLGNFPMLRSQDVADAITYCIQTPPHVQIHELTIKPIGETF
ncbi:PREDICTED: farnesol dehydrogenase [Drosophila arizonae]|uniref:Farnesol dehydrogenase n=1 Tax=Drosophila arizonae TaxID=7263 RepID=A0ABM1PR19_DROAR|nr:PREDICTED: farnesol dehydrogenase [Drosophila arizonae]